MSVQKIDALAHLKLKKTAIRGRVPVENKTERFFQGLIVAVLNITVLLFWYIIWY